MVVIIIAIAGDRFVNISLAVISECPKVASNLPLSVTYPHLLQFTKKIRKDVEIIFLSRRWLIFKDYGINAGKSALLLLVVSTILINRQR